jgi:hydrogenase maturation protease
MTLPGTTLLIGIGHEYRRDDGVGLVIARELEKRALPGTAIVEAAGGGMALIESWWGAERVFLVDAVSSGGQAGTVHRLDAKAQALPAGLFPYSTHGWGLAETLALTRVLDPLPPQFIIYGIEGGNFGWGRGLTAAVAGAARQVIERLTEEID